MTRPGPLPLAAATLALLLCCSGAGRCLAGVADAAAEAQNPDARSELTQAGAPQPPAPPAQPAQPAPAPARPAEARPPYLAMRELEQMQDRIAAGDALAAAGRGRALARAAAAFAAAKPAAWGEARNARALVLYLLSGGDAAAIRRAVPRSALPKTMADLYEGALGYGLGDNELARRLLGPVDPRTLPTALGGHLALVQAALIAEPAKAIERLDLARLLAPGTLVEEAALRREMGLVDVRTAAIAKFAQLSRRYAGAFPHSVYYSNFRQLVRQAAADVVRPDEGTAADAGEAVGGRLALVTEALEPRDRRRLLLLAARDALMSGRMATAATAAEQVIDAKADAKADGRADGRIGADRARALVYFGAALIAGPRHEAARAALLAAADRGAGGEGAGLGAGDEALRLAALSVADTIRDPAFAAPPSRGGADEAAIRDGERALAAAADAIKGAAP